MFIKSVKKLLKDKEDEETRKECLQELSNTDSRNQQEYQFWKRKCKQSWTPDQKSQYNAKSKASQSLEKEGEKQAKREKSVETCWSPPSGSSTRGLPLSPH